MLPVRYWRPAEGLPPGVLTLAFFPSVPAGGLRRWLATQLPGWALQPGPPPWRLHDALGGWAGVSFSYADGAAVLAVAPGHWVGVDLLPPQPPPDAIAVARLYLGAGLADTLSAAPLHSFALHWAAYEARQKCHGLGVRELVPGQACYATADTCCSEAIWLDGGRYLCRIAYREWHGQAGLSGSG
jgi:hypothetical protein